LNEAFEAEKISLESYIGLLLQVEAHRRANEAHRWAAEAAEHANTTLRLETEAAERANATLRLATEAAERANATHRWAKDDKEFGLDLVVLTVDGESSLPVVLCPILFSVTLLAGIFQCCAAEKEGSKAAKLRMIAVMGYFAVMVIIAIAQFSATGWGVQGFLLIASTVLCGLALWFLFPQHFDALGAGPSPSRPDAPGRGGGATGVRDAQLGGGGGERYLYWETADLRSPAGPQTRLSKLCWWLLGRGVVECGLVVELQVRGLW